MSSMSATTCDGSLCLHLHTQLLRGPACIAERAMHIPLDQPGLQREPAVQRERGPSVTLLRQFVCDPLTSNVQ